MSEPEPPARSDAPAPPPTTEPYPLMFPGGARIGEEEEAAVLRVIRSKRLFRYYGLVEGSSEVEAFEADFSRALSSHHAVAVGSGTLALMTALAAVGVGPGDQVIVPAYTWVSTPAAVLALGAVPIITEVDETLSIDVEDAQRRVGPRTRAVVPVHMRGAPADMDAVWELARRHDLAVVEDAAQAVGGSFRGRRLGTIGHVGAFSLQYNKIITCGEGGVVVTDDTTLHDRALMFHDVAASQRKEMGDTPVFFGLVARMTELQAAVAAVQLRRLDGIIADCRSKRARIVDAISPIARRQRIALRGSNDEAGDTAIALVLRCGDATRAGAVTTALRAAGIPARLLYEPGRVDLHVAHHWRPILERRSWSRVTPWDFTAETADDADDGWERTADLLGRSVHIDVSPDLRDDQIDAMSSHINAAMTSR